MARRLAFCPGPHVCSLLPDVGESSSPPGCEDRRKGTEASQAEKRQENPQAGLSLVEMDTCYLRMEITPGRSRA